MPVRVPELSAREVSRLSFGYVKGKHKDGQAVVNKAGTPCAAYHAVGGVAGLYLQCNPPMGKDQKEFGRSWIYRTTIAGKRRDIGLGSYPTVTLAMARELAREHKANILRGIDPLAAKREARSAMVRESLNSITFEQIAAEFIAKKSEEFDGQNVAKQVQKLTNQLEKYAYPFIGKMQINDITINHIADMLKPIWLTTKETAQRVRMSCNGIFAMAKSKGVLKGENPVNLEQLKHILPTPTGKKKTKREKVEHHPALPVNQLPKFYDTVKSDDALSAKLIRFGLLTASRPIEARSATWEQIDFSNKTWSLTIDNMKEGLAHVVPLSDEALAILRSIPKQGKYIFSADGKKPASENTANQRIKKLHSVDVENGGDGYLDPKAEPLKNSKGELIPRVCTQHGFRSTFKDWARKYTRYPDEWSELALAHVHDEITKEAYARDMLVEERRKLMADWANYCYSGHPVTKSNNVTAIGGRG